MGKDSEGSCCDTKTRYVSNEKLDRACKTLLEESERVFLADLDENKFMPHLFRAINMMRKELGMKQYILDVREEN